MKPVALATAALLCACNSPIDPLPLDDEAAKDDASNEPIVLEVEPEEEETPELTAVAGEAIPVSDVMRRLRGGPQISQAERRDRVWDLDNLPQEEAEVTALIRIWTSEIEMSNELDMIGIWQVIQNVRSRSCDNTRFGRSVIRRITQCLTDDGEIVEPSFEGLIPNASETYLSVMRRLSERALGIVPARSARGRWISEVTTSCEQPESWNRARPWEQVMQPRCEEYVPLARRLLSGAVERTATNAVIIAWGGRCERHCDDPTDPSTCRQTGACDDAIACRRRLARVPEMASENAFWCRPGTRGCPATVDPVCRAFGVHPESLEDPTELEISSETDLTREVTSS